MGFVEVALADETVAVILLSCKTPMRDPSEGVVEEALPRRTLTKWLYQQQGKRIEGANQ